MFTLRVLDLVAVALLCLRPRVSRAAKVALLGSSAFLVWYQNPVTCTCIRLPLVRCESAGPWLAMVRSDLRNLATQQEIHWDDHGRYSTDPQALAFVASNGVEVRIEATTDTWSAAAVHMNDEESCSIAVDGAPGREGARAEVVCGAR